MHFMPEQLQASEWRLHLDCPVMFPNSQLSIVLILDNKHSKMQSLSPSLLSIPHNWNLCAWFFIVMHIGGFGNEPVLMCEWLYWSC